jgi:hypothetical protein
LIAISVACGGGQETTVYTTTVVLLPKKVGSVNRSSEVRLFEGESLWEYINGGAEIYHQYGFVEVATAYYKTGETEITADVYKFDNADHAFGMLSTLRPDMPETVDLGTGGFTSETSLDFIKGEYLIRLTGYDQSQQTTAAIETLSRELEVRVPGTTQLPAALSLFPTDGKVAATEKLLARSYLGQVFLTDDSSGDKFSQWSAQAAEAVAAPEGLPYDKGKALKIDNSYYGEIVVGIKGSWLVGVVGYSNHHEALLADWLHSLP